MSVTDAIPQFLAELQVRNYSGRTVSDYRYHLRFFVRFLGCQGIDDLQGVTATTLAQFQHWLFLEPTRRGQARGAVNQNGILAATKSFFRFLHREGHLARDPAAAVAYAREPRTLPRNVLTPQEARRILEAVDITTVLGYRDRTILEVFYATGIRRNELFHLRPADVNLEEGLLRIIAGKGGHDRVVPLGQLAVKFLGTYLKTIRPQLLGNGQEGALFLSINGRALNAHTINDLVGKHAERARIKKRVTCHVWRHSCASHLLKNHANLRHVQDLLGHRSLATTERYLRLTITDLKEAHTRFHPRG